MNTVSSGSSASEPANARAESGARAPLSAAERVQVGRAARRALPRSSHAAFEPAADRPDPVDLLERQEATRVPELVPIRHGRMLTSAFAFFRGGALIMAADLAGAPRTTLHAQLCGDAHLSNFGVFASPERRLVFDINDFDETLPGPWEWDVKRLAASLEVAGRDNGFPEDTRRQVVVRAAAAYRNAMREFATQRTLDVWYARFEVDPTLRRLRELASPKAVKKTERELAKARTRDSLQALAKLTRMGPDGLRIASAPPLIQPVEELAAGMDEEQLRGGLNAILEAYRETLQPDDRRHLLESYRLVHLAHKVVGVGSVGTRAWVALLVGRDDGDPLFLQLKEAQPSVLEAFLGRSAYPNSGARVVAGQRLMQATSDIFLGWCRVRGLDDRERDFYGRQLRDWKGSATVEALDPVAMALYGELCGWTLARAHARSGDRIAIAAYLGGGDVFDRALCDFAAAYADQNERDYAAFARAVDEGRLEAVSGL